MIVSLTCTSSISVYRAEPALKPPDCEDEHNSKPPNPVTSPADSTAPPTSDVIAPPWNSLLSEFSSLTAWLLRDVNSHDSNLLKQVLPSSVPPAPCPPVA